MPTRPPPRPSAEAVNHDPAPRGKSLQRGLGAGFFCRLRKGVRARGLDLAALPGGECQRRHHRNKSSLLCRCLKINPLFAVRRGRRPSACFPAREKRVRAGISRVRSSLGVLFIYLSSGEWLPLPARPNAADCRSAEARRGVFPPHQGGWAWGRRGSPRPPRRASCWRLGWLPGAEGHREAGGL